MDDTCDSARWINEQYRQGVVSVIIPTFNRAGFLVEALDSAWRQTYRPLELLVIDDGSTDDTHEVIENWRRRHAESDDFNLLYRRQENAGACAARNLGLIESHGEYIQFLDSDDLLHPAKLQSQVDCFAGDRTLGFVYSGSASFVEEPDWDAKPYCGLAASRNRMIHEFLISHNCLWNSESGLYRRHTIMAMGPWNEDLPRFQDWEYNIRMLLLDTKVLHLPGTFSLARFHHEGRIGDAPMGRNKLRECLFAVQTVEHEIRAAGKLDADLQSGLAQRYLRYAATALIHGFTDVAAEAARMGGELDLDPWRRMILVLYKVLAFLPAGSVAKMAVAFQRVSHLARTIRGAFSLRFAGKRTIPT